MWMCVCRVFCICMCLQELFLKFSIESRKPSFVWSDNTPTHLAVIKVCVISLLYGVDVKGFAKLHAAMTVITANATEANRQWHTHAHQHLFRRRRIPIGKGSDRTVKLSRRSPLELCGKNQCMDIRLDGEYHGQRSVAASQQVGKQNWTVDSFFLDSKFFWPWYSIQKTRGEKSANTSWRQCISKQGRLFRWTAQIIPS